MTMLFQSFGGPNYVRHKDPTTLANIHMTTDPLPPPELSAARISWSAKATHAFGLMFLSCLTGEFRFLPYQLCDRNTDWLFISHLETLAFHGGVVLACFLLLPIARLVHRLFSRSRSPPSGTELQFR